MNKVHRNFRVIVHNIYVVHVITSPIKQAYIGYVHALSRRWLVQLHTNSRQHTRPLSAPPPLLQLSMGVVTMCRSAIRRYRFVLRRRPVSSSSSSASNKTASGGGRLLTDRGEEEEAEEDEAAKSALLLSLSCRSCSAAANSAAVKGPPADREGLRAPSGSSGGGSDRVRVLPIVLEQFSRSLLFRVGVGFWASKSFAVRCLADNFYGRWSSMTVGMEFSR